MPSGETVLKYQTGWIANGLSWSTRENSPFRFAVASFSQDYKNHIDIVQKNSTDELVCRATWEHCYPPTKILFAPQKATADLVITTADYLRLWEVRDGAPAATADTGKSRRDDAAAATATDEAKDGAREANPGADPAAVAAAAADDLAARKQQHMDSHVVIKRVFDSGKPNDFCSPVTSCDWNADDPNIVGCCSIDTTVTIWDLEASRCVTQLIAHDKDVYDIAFAKGTQTFATCGADGSVRIFDLREMEHCTVVYEAPPLSPLLRVAWNRLEQTYLATFGVDGTEVVVIDIRYPAVPIGTLKNGHTAPINSIGWAPNSPTHLCSAGEDSTANIWDLTDLPNVVPKCILNFRAENPINSVSWSSQHEQWIAITTGKEAQLLHI